MSTIRIERTTTKGYESKDYSPEDALVEINTEIDNKRTIWLDGKLFQDKFVTKEDLDKVKKEVTITNRLNGG